jgi:hypothetical protein
MVKSVVKFASELESLSRLRHAKQFKFINCGTKVNGGEMAWPV